MIVLYIYIFVNTTSIVRVTSVIDYIAVELTCLFRNLLHGQVTREYDVASDVTLPEWYIALEVRLIYT